MTTQEFIDRHKGQAIWESLKSGIPASIIMAQAIIESNSGNSRLARLGNNFFGIKCHQDWTGPTMTASDDLPNECFRVYHDPGQSFKDHTKFLDDNFRYWGIFDYSPSDYKSWATGLQRAGYATSPTYGTDLINEIESLGLNKLDNTRSLYKTGLVTLAVLILAVIVFLTVYLLKTRIHA